MNTQLETITSNYQADIDHAASVLNDHSAIEGIAVLGPAGSYSHIIAADLNSALAPERSLTVDFPDDFPRVLTAARYPGRVAILPLRNAIAGEVRHIKDGPTNQAMIQRTGFIVLAEIGLPIEHYLMGTAPLNNTDAFGLKVRSHVQALRQCTKEIKRRRLEKVEADSTSAAARSLRHEESTGEPILAIAPRIAAEVYGLAVIARDIGNEPPSKNITTMALVCAPTD